MDNGGNKKCIANGWRWEGVRRGAKRSDLEAYYILEVKSILLIYMLNIDMSEFQNLGLQTYLLYFGIQIYPIA